MTTTNTGAASLENCPFCGDADIQRGRAAIGERPTFHTYCNSCEAGTQGHPTREASDAAWNRRTTPQADAAPNVAEKFVPDAAMNFAAYLIDHCEGETITEESLQVWLGKMVKLPRYNPSLESTLASMTRMFHAACADLGAINEALGLDPDDGGAAPILDAIAELKSERDKWVDAGYAASANASQADAAIAAGGAQEAVKQSDARYVVIGYGETDHPQAAFANERERLLDAVLGMMYTKPADADAEIREAYAKDLADDDEWSEGIWSTEFEIGGITIYDLGYGSAASNGDQA